MAPQFELLMQRSLSADEDLSHAAHDEDEERKERNRQKVRRHYYRKLNMLNDLRTTVRTLKDKYDTLVAIIDDGAASGPLGGSVQLHSDRLTLLKQIESVRREHLRAMQEHKLLQVSVQKYVQVRLQVEELLLSEQVINTNEGRTALARATKNLSAQECREFALKALDDVIALETTPAFSNLDTDYINWCGHQCVEDGLWKYRLSRTLSGFQADTVARVTWSILSNPATIASMYSANVDMFCRLVQTVDDDNVIMFQEYSSLDFAGLQVFMKSLFLMTWIETKNGFRLIMRSIDPQHMLLYDLSAGGTPLRKRTGNVVWQDIFTWLTWERTGKDNMDCICEIAGRAATMGSNADRWAVEILELVTQWEKLFCGPLFSVPPEP